uniref:folate gamma-glutamyl hydrolase n=1 Tax=Arcella intermedia TaxID=1963864 RepID=A0A6B2LAP1_9EUKA
MLWSVVCWVCCVCCGLAFSEVNTRPIVGLLSQPTEDDQRSYGHSYIAASYVKFFESAGARVVPIFYDTPHSVLHTLFNQINAVFFPGGDSDLLGTQLYTTAHYLYQLAEKANDGLDYFPIYGHCMGFQLLSLITSRGNGKILTHFDAENISLPLQFYPNFKNSKLFGPAGDDILDIMGNQNVTMNNHQYGVSPAVFSSDPYLSTFYDVLSWNTDPENRPFVSTIEAKDYPFYGLQWHAEKPIFEWSPTEAMNHSPDSIKANQYIANFYVNEARKSTHKFSTLQTEQAALIYNYPKTYTGHISSFEETYFFPPYAQLSQ